MAEEILDGTGGGKSAKVDDNFRLHTHSVGETVAENASQNGDSYNINTGTVALTTATESAVLYLKNNADFDLHISTIGFLLGTSTSGTGDLLLRVDKNVTGGTIVSTALVVAINQNKNVGSSQVLTVDAFAGAEGRTATGGTTTYTSLLAGAARGYVISTGDVVIPKGGNIAVFVTPQTSNSAMNVQIFTAIAEYKLT